MDSTEEEKIRQIVESKVSNFSTSFESRHAAELSDPDGTINSKVHNSFIAALGEEIQFFSALVRSLDSSMGSLIEDMALAIAETHFQVSQQVEGKLYEAQTTAIAKLLSDYQTRRKSPTLEDIVPLRKIQEGSLYEKRHASDYVLTHRKTGEVHLIELKLGGDLDNKKARSEKEALLEQFCILSNSCEPDQKIDLHFATAYNRYGEGNDWVQQRVLQFFAKDELLISRDFWNFLTQDLDGFNIVQSEFKKQAHQISTVLDKLKSMYVK